MPEETYLFTLLFVLVVLVTMATPTIFNHAMTMALVMIFVVAIMYIVMALLILVAALIRQADENRRRRGIKK